MNDGNIFVHLPPLALGVSLVYSATRYEDTGLILRRTGYWTVYIVGFLLIAWGLLFMFDVLEDAGRYVVFALAAFMLARWLYRLVRPRRRAARPAAPAAATPAPARPVGR